MHRRRPAPRTMQSALSIALHRKSDQQPGHLLLAALDGQVQRRGLAVAALDVEARAEQHAHALDPPQAGALEEPLAQRPQHAVLPRHLDQAAANVKPPLVQDVLWLVRHVVAPPAGDVPDETSGSSVAGRRLGSHLCEHEPSHVEVPVLQRQFTREYAMIIYNPRVRAVAQQQPCRLQRTRLAAVVQCITPVLVTDATCADLVLTHQGGNIHMGIPDASLEEGLIDEALLLVDIMALRALRAQNGLHMQLDLADDTINVNKHGYVAVAILALLEAVVNL
mmetsp:Transcript_43779/g.126531  ORF Transcript_43779/g.126531 Transcript_43779/m.126531 type:complete len:279 (-) Transcript_43779:2001-2837(-)